MLSQGSAGLQHTLGVPTPRGAVTTPANQHGQRRSHLQLAWAHGPGILVWGSGENWELPASKKHSNRQLPHRRRRKPLAPKATRLTMIQGQGQVEILCPLSSDGKDLCLEPNHVGRTSISAHAERGQILDQDWKDPAIGQHLMLVAQFVLSRFALQPRLG